MVAIHNKAFTMIELVFSILVISIIYYFGFTGDDNKEQNKSPQTEYSRAKSEYNNKLISDEDYDGHRLYNKVFNKK